MELCRGCHERKAPACHWGVEQLAAAFALGQAIGMGILAKVPDRWGRKKVLLVLALGRTLSTAMIGTSRSYPIVVGGRVMSGLFSGTTAVATAFLADVTTSEERTSSVATLEASASLGQIIGPLVGGALSHSGFGVTCYTAAALGAVNLLVGALVLSDPDRPNQDPPSGEPASTPEQPARIPWSAGLLYLGVVLSTLGPAAFESVAWYYATDTYFAGDLVRSEDFYSKLLSCAGVTTFVTTVCIMKPIDCVKRMGGEKRAVTAGSLIGAVGCMGMSMAPTPCTFAVMAVLSVAGGSLVKPTLSSMLTMICPEHTVGRAVIYEKAVKAVARTGAPLVFGRLYERYDPRVSFYVNAATNILLVLLAQWVFPSPPRKKTLAGEAVEADADAADGAAANSDSEVVEALEDLERGKPDETSAPALDGSDQQTEFSEADSRDMGSTQSDEESSPKQLADFSD
ncbi:tetA [Symbiodinium sp. CCMP2592]|nr:tetA [Symbiodinium sp. CCMP2592]